MAMTRKPAVIRFDADLLDRIDVAALAAGVSRNVYVVAAVEQLLERGDVLQEKARMVREVREVGPKIVLPPSEQTIKRAPTAPRPKSILDGLDIADGPIRRPYGSGLKKR